MSEGFVDRPVPRGLLLGAAGLVGFVLITSTVARVSGTGTAQFTAASSTPPVASLELRFEDRADGGVAVLDARGGEVVEVLPPGSNGFVRGVMRALARERRSHEVGPGPAFRLSRWQDGRLSLEDTATGRYIELTAFGPTNRDAFARLLGARHADAPRPPSTADAGDAAR